MPDESPLTIEEIEEVRRLFRTPFFIPSAFKTWMAEQATQNIPDLPLGTLFGGRAIPRSLEATVAASAASANGTTGVLYSKVVQGGTMGANGRLRLMIEGHYVQSSGSQSFTIDVLFGGTIVATLTESSAANNRTYVIEISLFNGSSPSVQFCTLNGLRLTDGASVGNTVGFIDNGEATVDTRVDQTLKVQITFGGTNANDVWTRTYANLEIFNPVPLGATL